MTVSARTFARPADLAPDTLALAEYLWMSTSADGVNAEPEEVFLSTVDRLAALLHLGDGDGHDELTRCDRDGCDAWFWADEGARVTYESGRTVETCPEHAVADDPFARVCPGVSLEAAWREQGVGQARFAIRRVEELRVWRNEDGREFVFADELWEALAALDRTDGRLSP